MQHRLLVYAVLVITTSGISANRADPLPVQCKTNTIASAVPSDQSFFQNRRCEAQTMYRAEKFERAATQLKALIDSGSKQACDYYWLGESYYHMDKYADAAAAFREAVKLDPTMDTAKVRLAEARLATKNLSEAHAACTEALATVSDPYARKQLEVISKVTSSDELPVLSLKDDNDVELAHSGTK